MSAASVMQMYRTKILKEYPIADKVRPFKHRVLVHVAPPAGDTKTEAGIIITARARGAEVDTCFYALIIKAGHAVHEDVQPGRWVAIPPFAGTALMHEHAGDTGANYRIIVEDAIMYFVNEEEIARQLALD